MPDTQDPNQNPTLDSDRTLARVPTEEICSNKSIDRDALEAELRRRYEDSKLD